MTIITITSLPCEIWTWNIALNSHRQTWFCSEIDVTHGFLDWKAIFEGEGFPEKQIFAINQPSEKREVKVRISILESLFSISVAFSHERNAKTHTSKNWPRQCPRRLITTLCTVVLALWQVIRHCIWCPSPHYSYEEGTMSWYWETNREYPRRKLVRERYLCFRQGENRNKDLLVFLFSTQFPAKRLNNNRLISLSFMRWQTS